MFFLVWALLAASAGLLHRGAPALTGGAPLRPADGGPGERGAREGAGGAGAGALSASGAGEV